MSNPTVDTAVLIGPDHVAVARELIRLVERMPWRPPERYQNESNEDWEARCDAEWEEFKASCLVNIGRGARQAVIMILRRYFESHKWAASPILLEGSYTEAQFLEMLLDNIGLRDEWSTKSRLFFISFLTEVVPEIMRHADNIPELRRNGGQIPDDVYMAIFDESGQLTMPRVVRLAIVIVNRFKNEGGITPEIARTMCVALMNGDFRMMESILTVSNVVAEEAKRVREENPGLTAGEVADIVGSTTDAVRHYLRNDSETKSIRMQAKVQWTGDNKFTILIEGHSREELSVLMSRARNLIDFEEWNE